MSEDIVYISNARLSFPNLIEPQKTVSQETGKERISYNCELLMPPNDPGYMAFMKRYGALALEKWKENATAAMTMIHSDRKSRCYGQGEEKVKKATFQPYDGYPGMVYISVGSKYAPQLIQADGTPIDSNNTMAYQQLARRLYGGCRVNAAIKPWIQVANAQKKYGNGVRCDLIAIQFAGDDEPFGEGVPDASSMFKSVAPAAAGPSPGGASLPPFLMGQ